MAARDVLAHMNVCSVVVAAWAAFVLGAALWASIRSAREMKRASKSFSLASVLLMRACAGDEPGLLHNLSSFPRCDPKTRFAVRLAIPSPRDTAAPAALAAVRTLEARGVNASVVTTGPGGPNNKAHQLAVALSSVSERYSHIVVADSDVDLEDVQLDDLVAGLEDPRIGAVWAPPVEVCATTWGDRVSAAVLDASMHSFRLLAALDGRTMVGKLFAVRAVDLETIGGFAALQTHLGEDAELSRRLRTRGLSVQTAPLVARSTVRGRSVGAVVARFSRWLWVVRAQRAALLVSYPLFLAPLPAMVVLAVLGNDRYASCALLASVAARTGIAALARALSKRPMRWTSLLLDAVIADTCLIVALAVTLCARRIRWRGRLLRVSSAGTVVDDS